MIAKEDVKASSFLLLVSAGRSGGNGYSVRGKILYLVFHRDIILLITFSIAACNAPRTMGISYLRLSV